MSRDIVKVNNKYYKILTLLKKGTSSCVYLVENSTKEDDNNTSSKALRIVNLSTITDKSVADSYLNEVGLLHKLQGCPCVIKMYDYEYDEKTKHLYVLMERGGQDLSKYLEDFNKQHTFNPIFTIIDIWHEMLLTVKEIHARSIIHSNLKPDNFLFVGNVLKIIDFGIASAINDDMTSVHKNIPIGTLDYMSPETVQSNNISEYRITYKSDVWSLGCILYNMVYGKTPYSHITQVWAKMNAIANDTHKIEFKTEFDNKIVIPPTLMESMKLCLQKEPERRPTVQDLLNLSESRLSQI